MKPVYPVHIPANCPACYALLSVPEQHIPAVRTAGTFADIVKRLVAGAPQGAKWYRPERTPICLQEENTNE